MSTTTHLDLGLLTASQAQKETTHNDALIRLDAAVQASVINRTTTAPPGSPAAGDAYIIAATATGAWAGKERQIAFYHTGWIYLIPREGWQVYDQTTNEMLIYSGTAWVSFSAGSGLVAKAGDTMTGPLVLPAGTAAASSLDMNGQGGLFSGGAGEFNWSIGGTEIGSFNAFGIGIGGDAASGQQLVVSSTGIARIVLNGGSTTNFLQTRYSGDALSSGQSLRKSRGTAAAPAAVAQNDILGDVVFWGRGATAFQTGGRHFATVIATTPSDTDMESRLLGSCSPAASVTLTEIYRYDHATGFSLFGANPVIDQDRLHRMRSYTVATLPAAGTAGRRAMVTDALAPAFLGALTGGGAVVTPVFDNGTAWVAG